MLHDYFGGDLIIADVCVDGMTIGVHYWNRLPFGGDVDITREQFRPGEALCNPRVVVRPADLPKNGVDAYLLLARRVRERLTKVDGA